MWYDPLMRVLLTTLTCSLGLASLLLSETVTSTLTLVEDESAGGDLLFNEVIIEVGSSGVSDSDSTILTGSTEATFEVDPATGRATEMTLDGGRFTATDISFRGGSPPLAGFTATSVDPTGNTMLGGTLTTMDPPGELTPAVEEGKSTFDASQYIFTIDSGILDVSVFVFFDETKIPFDFNTTPVAGAGEGEGTVCLTETSRDDESINYDVVAIFPVMVDQMIMEPDSPEVNVEAAGTIKAVGTLTIPNLSPYQLWTTENGIPNAPFDGDANGDGVPNGLQWSLGLSTTDSPWPHLLKPSSAREFAVTLPPGGSAAPLTVQVTSDPESVPFTPLEPGAVSVGNPIPAGTNGTVTITLPAGAPNFVQLLTTEP